MALLVNLSDTPNKMSRIAWDVPYKDAQLHLNAALKGKIMTVAQAKLPKEQQPPKLKLKERAILLANGIALLIPVINIIVDMALRLSVVPPKTVEPKKPLYQETWELAQKSDSKLLRRTAISLFEKAFQKQDEPEFSLNADAAIKKVYKFELYSVPQKWEEVVKGLETFGAGRIELKFAGDFDVNKVKKVLEPLKDNLQLERVDLSGTTKMRSPIGKVLTNVTQLEHLDLSNSHLIGDGDIAELASMTNLSRLLLNNCKALTNHSLASLGKITTLKHLEISGGNKMTEEGLQNFQKALPECTIVTNIET